MISIGEVGLASEGDLERVRICFEELVSFEDIDADPWLSFERVEWSALILRTISSVRSSQVVGVGFDGIVEVISI